MKQFNLTLLAILISICSFAGIPVSPISGGGNVCKGGTLPLSDATGGGTWSSSNAAIATVGSAGMVTGVAAGTATITYTVGASYAIDNITVNPLPTAYTIYASGSGAICAGSSGDHILLSNSQTGVSYQLYTGGTPVSSSMAGTGAPIDFGATSAAGTYTVMATNITTGCTASMAGTATISLLPTPSAIGGPSSVCVGSSITLTDTTSGGAWSSSNTAVATAGSAGVVAGIAAGITVISYTLSSGCMSTISINAINLVSPISGPALVCTGMPATLNSGTHGGTWSSSNTSVATINSAGVVRGSAAGTTTISYVVSGTCGAATSNVTVHATPASITGVTSICNGAVSTLNDATPAGVWSSNNASIATIGSSSGIATSVAAGTDTIKYTVGGCSVSAPFSIAPRPTITGPANICVTSFITLHTNINGSWTSSNPGVASVVAGFMDATVTGIYPGSTVLTCNSYATGCVSTYTVTVTSVCTGTPAAGIAHAVYPALCSGSPDTLYLTANSNSCGISYQWQYSTDSIAWADIAGATGDTAFLHPEATLYYRCKLTCFSMGAYSYSAGVKVTAYNHITAQSIISIPSASCTGPDFHIATCGISPATNVLTYYGDGTYDSTYLVSTSADSSATTDIYHNYSLPGEYTVKQVLRDGTTRKDSATFFYGYNYCNTLPVGFYFDANNNCIYDNGDGAMYRPVTTEVDSNGIAIDTITAVNGFYYEANGGAGTVYGFKVIAHDTGLHLSCPAGVLYDTIGAYANTYTVKSFGFTCNTSSAFDLGVLSNISCGTQGAQGFIDVSNSYCNAQTAIVTMRISPKYNFSSSWPAPTSVSGNVVTWNLSSLSVYTPSGGNWPYIWFRLNVAGASLTAGDTVNTTYQVTPYTGDADTSNNFIARVDTIMASYGADQLSVSPMGAVIPCTPLIYTVAFENTGNDTAHNMYVTDTLPDNADPTTIKLIAASAAVNMVTAPANGHTLVKFDFPDINLPDSSHHNQSNGFVVFSVNVKAGLTDGSVLQDHANVYADDNAPASTNILQNTTGINPVTGPASVCNTQQIQLADASASGSWSSMNGHATVTSGGLVTGVTPGTDAIVYTLTNMCGTRTATQTVTINPAVTPSASITTSLGAGDTVCDGTIPVFTVTPVNGGSAPAFIWQVNGSGSATGNTYSFVPANGDVLSVKMTSNALCALPDTASTSMTLAVVTPYAPAITITAHPDEYVTTGTPDTFVVTLPPGGPGTTYQWLLNGHLVAGATTNTFVDNPPANNDSITCIVTGEDLCHLAMFNSVVITVGNVGVKNVSSQAEIVLFPNPNDGTFTIRGSIGNVQGNETSAAITNVLGETVYKAQIPVQNGIINRQIQPAKTLQKGMYLMTLHSDGDNIVFRFVVE